MERCGEKLHHQIFGIVLKIFSAGPNLIFNMLTRSLWSSNKNASPSICCKKVRMGIFEYFSMKRNLLLDKLNYIAWKPLSQVEIDWKATGEIDGHFYCLTILDIARLSPQPISKSFGKKTEIIVFPRARHAPPHKLKIYKQTSDCSSFSLGNYK